MPFEIVNCPSFENYENEETSETVSCQYISILKRIRLKLSSFFTIFTSVSISETQPKCYSRKLKFSWLFQFITSLLRVIHLSASFSLLFVSKRDKWTRSAMPFAAKHWIQTCKLWKRFYYTFEGNFSRHWMINYNGHWSTFKICLIQIEINPESRIWTI